MNSNVGNSNGLAAELAHLQCTCDHSNGKILNIIRPHPETEVKNEDEMSSKHDDVAVLEEEDVVLEEEELVKVDVLDEEDEEEDEDEFNGPIFADEDEVTISLQTFLWLEFQKARLFLNCNL